MLYSLWLFGRSFDWRFTFFSWFSYIFYSLSRNWRFNMLLYWNWSCNNFRWWLVRSRWWLFWHVLVQEQRLTSIADNSVGWALILQLFLKIKRGSFHFRLFRFLDYIWIIKRRNHCRFAQLRRQVSLLFFLSWLSLNIHYYFLNHRRFILIRLDT